ncbi:MAG: virulence factor family protein [Gammaproteobacteria bacterium]|nr:virulence factor family protein [Gammaproteobacteria bacterium]
MSGRLHAGPGRPAEPAGARRLSFALLALLAACLPGGAPAGPLAAPPYPANAAPPSPADAAPMAHAAPVAHDRYASHLPTGRFGTVTVYLPEGTPRSVAIFLSGDGGWVLGVLDMAHALSDMGAGVIGVHIGKYFANLRRAAQRPGAPCQSIAADLESLSHEVQKEIGLRDYHVPVLVGYSSGATVVYAALVQSPPGTFAGALSLGFCPDQDFAGAALCPGEGRLRYSENQQHELVLAPAPSLHEPWIALQGEQDQVCSALTARDFAARVAGGEVVALPHVGHGFGVARNWMPQFRAAYARLAPRAAVAARPPDIGDLPLQEVHASGSADELALLLTGDGGWAGLDRELAARLAASGVPTVGLNSLKYFWTARTPDETARDVARILRHYLTAWHRERVLLIGYSFGADVLPFVVRRLPGDLRARLLSVSLLGIDANASFEIRIAGWVGANAGDLPTRPELAELAPLHVLCVYGEGEEDSICPGLTPQEATREQVGKGHHFSGEYATLADLILAFARGRRPVT